MPRYDYRCPKHGRFERYAGYDDSSVRCDCGLTAQREAVYEQAVIFRGTGFTKSVIPPASAEADVQSELRKDLKKKGWDTDRAVEELRANSYKNEKGQTFVNTQKMTREA